MQSPCQCIARRWHVSCNSYQKGRIFKVLSSPQLCQNVRQNVKPLTEWQAASCQAIVDYSKSGQYRRFSSAIHWHAPCMYSNIAGQSSPLLREHIDMNSGYILEAASEGDAGRVIITAYDDMPGGEKRWVAVIPYRRQTGRGQGWVTTSWTNSLTDQWAWDTVYSLLTVGKY